MSETSPTILILGGGINGAAIARELVLNGVNVVVVDTADICFGATACSSRLIHGGLRYLEYGEFGLVRESLQERTRLLQLAPQFVQPLRLSIPVTNRFGGVVESVRRFLGWEAKGGAAPPQRGRWLVAAGLSLYDWYARDPTLPRHSTRRVADVESPQFDSSTYRWICRYHDAQIRFPERFVVALLEDARRVAANRTGAFDVLTYHQAVMGSDGEVRISPGREADPTANVTTLHPAAVINATGAWVDHTLERLQVDSRRLMGGTKGSHLVADSAALRKALGGEAVYAEAEDGRPVFVLPWGDATLIGTTDIPFDGDPADAVAGDEEVEYLVDTVNSILPAANLSLADVRLHYCGVRPLPYVDASTPGAVTRRHWLESHPGAPIPTYSVIGGKLTTCRSLADETATKVLADLGIECRSNSRDRPIPGAADFPTDSQAVDLYKSGLAKSSGFADETVTAAWSLWGTDCETRLQEVSDQISGNAALVADTALPRELVRWVIRHEWARTVSDLVERRLMLLYERRLTRNCLAELADLLVEEGAIDRDDRDDDVEQCIERLRSHFGRSIE